jgi:hypothetical protein
MKNLSLEDESLLSFSCLLDRASRLTLGGRMSEITPKKIEKMIYVIRDQKVMLDCDLAELYGVETKYLNRQVKRNRQRFPSEFMFKLSKEEVEALRCQFVTFNESVKGRKYLPFVFNEYGIAMLSGVLNSEQAISVNIGIVKTFIKLRKYLESDELLIDRVEQIEQGTDKLFRIVFERLESIEERQPLLPRERNKIGLK